MYIILQDSTDNGGSAIIKYELWVDAGNDFNSGFTQLTNYAGNVLLYGATSATDGLVLGRVYRFKARALNAIGYSDFSEDAYISYGAVPNTPATPILLKSTMSSVKVSWTPPSSSDLPVTGYILNMDNGRNGDI